MVAASCWISEFYVIHYEVVTLFVDYCQSSLSDTASDVWQWLYVSSKLYKA